MIVAANVDTIIATIGRSPRESFITARGPTAGVTVRAEIRPTGARLDFEGDFPMVNTYIGLHAARTRRPARHAPEDRFTQERCASS